MTRFSLVQVIKTLSHTRPFLLLTQLVFLIGNSTRFEITGVINTPEVARRN